MKINVIHQNKGYKHLNGHKKAFNKIQYQFTMEIPNKPGLKGNNNHLSSHSFWGQESRCGFTEGLWLKVSRATLSTGASVSFKHATSRGHNSKLTHMAVGRIPFLMGYGLRTSVPPSLLPGGLPQSFAIWASPQGSSQHGVWLPSEQARKGEWIPRWKPQSFYDRNFKVTFFHFWCFPFIRTKSRSPAHTKEKEIPHSMNKRRWGSLGAILETAYYKGHLWKKWQITVLILCLMVK